MQSGSLPFRPEVIMTLLDRYASFSIRLPQAVLKSSVQTILATKDRELSRTTHVLPRPGRCLQVEFQSRATPNVSPPRSTHVKQLNLPEIWRQLTGIVHHVLYG